MVAFSLRVIEHTYSFLRVSARDPRRARATSYILSVWFGLQTPPEASRGPNEPKYMFSGCPQRDIIMVDNIWTCWTLPTCSNMPCTTLIITIVCLVWPLEASRGPNEPKYVFSGCPQRDMIVKYHFWTCWTLPTCTTMPYTTCIRTIVCLVWPLEASRGPRAQNEPNWVFSGRPQSDIIVKYHSWARVSPPTTSGGLSISGSLNG